MPKMTLEERTRAAVADIFNANTATCVPFPLLPGGVRVIDSTGKEMVFYWDIMTDQLDWEFPQLN